MAAAAVTRSLGNGGSRRNVALDALRGLAAFAVMLYHYTYHFNTVYPSHRLHVPGVPWAGYSVNVFFLLSGYVIFMTLERTERSLDFLVSRVTRIYPAFWVAVALTFAAVAAFGLPGRRVSLTDGLVNLSMVPAYLNRPLVDGVYWTLEIELFFYAVMLGMHVLRLLRGRRLAISLTLLLAGCEGAFTLLGGPGHARLSNLLATAGFAYFQLFLAGICVYVLRVRSADRLWFQVLLTASVVVDIWRHGVASGVATMIGISLIWLATHPRISRVEYRPLVFLGFISYPLYLVHQNIGYIVLFHLHMPAGFRILLALCLSVALATAISYTVEHPATRMLRSWYRRLQARRPATRN